MRKLTLVIVVPFLFSVFVLAGKNPADYPLKIQIIESHWDRHHGILEGWGRGNIKDGDSIRAFDFSYSAAEPFHRTIGDAYYIAKWKKEALKMELLVGEIGATDKYQTFDLKTSVRDDVYVRSPEGAVAISQQEYKAQSAK